MKLRPKVAHRLNDANEQQDVAVEDVHVGDRIVVMPGEQFPVDGVLVSENTRVDESLVTGESTSLLKEKGMEVLLGTVNIGTESKFKPAIVSVTRVGSETSLSQIIKMVEQAQVIDEGMKKKSLLNILEF